MNLKSPHLIWKTAGSNPYEVSKAVQQARFLSGRYRSAELEKHWTHNKEGFCLNCNSRESESIEHILLNCIAYTDTKKKLYNLWLSTKIRSVYILVLEALSSNKEYLLQFLLDCSVLPTVIRATQQHGYGVILSYKNQVFCHPPPKNAWAKKVEFQVK